MKILILAGGYGTRLYPLIKDEPKALLRVNDQALIDYVMNKLSPLENLNQVMVVTNQKFVGHFEKWKETHKDFPAEIVIVNDGTQTPDDRLGSIGDINFVLENVDVDDDLAVIGSDNLFDEGLEGFVKLSQSKSPQVTMGVYDLGGMEEASKYGVVALDDDQKIDSFEEKPESPKSSLIAMCLYYFPKESLGLIDQYLKETGTSDTAGDYIKWLCRNNSVYGFKFTGKWYDIGSIESYEKAQKDFGN